MADVRHLFVCFVHRFPMKEHEEVEVVENRGFSGCARGRLGSKRRVLVIDEETLNKVGVPAGALKENSTTSGLDHQKVGVGHRLQIGQSIVEIATRCEACGWMDEIRMRLREELRGQRGWFCSVVKSGKIRRGDRIEVAAPLTELSG